MTVFRRDDIPPNEAADALRRLRAEAAAQVVLDREAAMRDGDAARLRRELAADRGEVPGHPRTGAPQPSEEHLQRLDRIANAWRGEAACEAECALLAAARAKAGPPPAAAAVGPAPASRALADSREAAWADNLDHLANAWKGTA